LRYEKLSLMTTRSIWKMLGPLANCEPPLHCQSPGVASRTPAIAIVQAACDVHNDDDDNNDNAWQRGLLWPHGMGPISILVQQMLSMTLKTYNLRAGIQGISTATRSDAEHMALRSHLQGSKYKPSSSPASHALPSATSQHVPSPFSRPPLVPAAPTLLSNHNHR